MAVTVDDTLVAVRLNPVLGLLTNGVFFLALSALLDFSLGVDLAETVVGFLPFGDCGDLDLSDAFRLSGFLDGELDLVLILVGIRERELRR